MQTYSNDQYNQIFSKLPKEIRDVISSYNSVEKIWKIGEKHKLHIDQTGNLNGMSLDVMMGIIPSGKFTEELAKEIGISKIDASSIVRDIDEEIFKPIKELMVKTYADGAPYRPKSSLRTSHEDENHEDIERDELLKSIEEPEVSQVKKWRSDGTIESIVTFSDTKQFSKTPDQEVFKKSEPEEQLNLSQTLKESRERLLNLISSKKLDSVITMNPHEKKEENKPTPPSFESIEKKPEPIIQEKPIEVQKMPENPFIVVPKVEPVQTPVLQQAPQVKIIDPVAKPFKQPLVPEIAPQILPANIQTPITVQAPKEMPVAPKIPMVSTQTTFNVVDPYREQ